MALTNELYYYKMTLVKILSYDRERSHDVLYDDDGDDCCYGNGGDGNGRQGNDVDSDDVLMSCNVGHPYYCCYDDGDRDVDGDDDDGQWTRRNGVYAVTSYCYDLVMWNVHMSETYLCDENDDDFLS